MEDEDVMGDPAHDTGPSGPPLLEQTIGANLAATVARHGGRDALVDAWTGRRWTYDELLAAVRRLAAGFLRLGVAPGDRVGIWAPNVPEWTLVQHATAEIGAVLVNINPAYRAHELEYVLTQSGVRVVVAAVEHRGSDYAAMLDAVAPRCPAPVRTVILGTAEWGALADGEPDDAAVAEVAMALSPGDPINVQYTSGTTGFPKGATLSHRNILNNGYLVGELVHYTEADRVCIPVSTTASAWSGATSGPPRTAPPW